MCPDDFRSRVIVSICGPAGSGKSYLSQKLVEKMGSDISVRVPGDYFILPTSPLTESLGQYLHRPLQYDWHLLDQTVAEPEGTVVTTPPFDFTTFQRTRAVEVRKFAIRPIMIVDAMYPYPRADIHVLVTAPDDIRRYRISQRDRIWGTEVAERWVQLERSRTLLEELGIVYDLTLSGTDCVDRNANLIGELMGSGLDSGT